MGPAVARKTMQQRTDDCDIITALNPVVFVHHPEERLGVPTGRLVILLLFPPFSSFFLLLPSASFAFYFSLWA